MNKEHMLKKKKKKENYFTIGNSIFVL